MPVLEDDLIKNNNTKVQTVMVLNITSSRGHCVGVTCRWDKNIKISCLKTIHAKRDIK